MQFDDLKLIDPILRAVRAEGYTTPTPIQEQAIPYVLEGRDLLGCAQTGTGKTAAFALPILQYLTNNPRRDRSLRVLVLAPTRELASQIGDSFQAYGRNTNVRHTVIFGGVGQKPQTDALQRSPEVLVATPGRLLDLMQQGYIRLDRIEVFVLDEADRMLDMGFIHDVKRIIAKLPGKRQTLFFSATMPPEIQSLADSILTNPAYVAVTPVASTVDLIQQSVYFVEKKDKPALLEHLLRDRAVKRALVFTRTKHGANKVVKQLDRAGIDAEAIHGDKSQSARERALANFKAGQIPVLVATDIAARGLDVDDITHVINYDLTNEPETYVHRIGRTARAGASGAAYSLVEVEERPYLRDIERLIQRHVPVVSSHPYQSTEGAPSPTDLNPQRRSSPQKSAQPNRSNNGNRASNGSGQRSGTSQGNNQQRNSSQQPRAASSQSSSNSNGRTSNGNNQQRNNSQTSNGQSRSSTSQSGTQSTNRAPQSSVNTNANSSNNSNQPKAAASQPASNGSTGSDTNNPGRNRRRRRSPRNRSTTPNVPQ